MRATAPWLPCLCLLMGCAGDPRVELDFTRRVPVGRSATDRSSTLRVAVGAMISPEGTYRSYAGLAAYLARQVDRQPQIVQRRTYAETNRLLVGGDVDLALICTGAYVAVRDRVVFVAAPIVAGRPTYRSVLIARRGGPATLDDLRGARFAYTDELSNSGRLYPEFRVRQRFGLDAADFFGDLIFSGGHDESIGLVLDGAVDAAAVDELVLESFLRAHAASAGELRRLDVSPPFGTPPLVARADLDPRLLSRLRDVLLRMGRDEATRSLLAPTGIEGFTTEVDYGFAITVAERVAAHAERSGR